MSNALNCNAVARARIKTKICTSSTRNISDKKINFLLTSVEIESVRGSAHVSARNVDPPPALHSLDTVLRQVHSIFHSVQSSASSCSFHDPLLFLRSSSTSLRLLPRLLVTYPSFYLTCNKVS